MFRNTVDRGRIEDETETSEKKVGYEVGGTGLYGGKGDRSRRDTVEDRLESRNPTV